MADIGGAWLFSEINGTLHSEGTPLAGKKLIRQYEYGSLQSDEAVTDSNGRFHFPAVQGRSLAGLLPMEFVVAQSIVAVIDGKEHLIWSNTKRSREQNSELGGIPLNLDCNLSDDLKIYRDFGSILRTRCTW